MKWRLTVSDIVKLLGGIRPIGQFKGEVTGIADLRSAREGDLSFLGSGKYARFLPESKAGVILVPEGQEGQPPEGQVWLPVPDASLALGAVCRRVEKLLCPAPEPGIHPTALVDPTAEIDPTASVGPWCLLGPRVRIGARTVVESSVRLEQDSVVGEDTEIRHGAVIGWSCRIGNRCRIFANAVLGSDGFGYHSDKNGHQRLPQVGIVVVEDDVDIGACTTIDRARFAETRIGQGTKVDNQVQIGHNVNIGRHCIICSMVGISGSAELGNFVIFAGQVGVAGHLKVGDGVIASGKTGITKDVPAGAVISGNPAQPNREELKARVLMRQLPQLADRLKALEDALQEND